MLRGNATNEILRNGQVGAVDQVINQHADDTAEFVGREAPQSVIDAPRRNFAAASHWYSHIKDFYLFPIAFCWAD